MTEMERKLRRLKVIASIRIADKQDDREQVELLLRDLKSLQRPSPV